MTTLLLLTVPVLLSALVTRLLFETLAGVDQSKLSVRCPCAVPTAAGCGAGVVTTAGALLGVPVSLAGAAASASMIAVALLAATLLRRYEQRRGTANRRIFFVGSDSQARDLAREVHRRGDMRLAGRARLGPLIPSEEAVIENVLSTKATTLVMSAEAIRDEHLVAAASRLNLQGVRVRALNHFYEEEFEKVPFSDLSPSWFLFDVSEIHRATLYRFGKRAMEMAVATAVLIATAPIFPLIALAIKLSSPGPILYRQQRVGKHGERFALTKFRTMRVALDDEAPAWSTEHGHRVTSVGRFLRRYRLDELPQLIHVVRGHLSLVGPRPEQPEIVERLERSMEFYGARHCVRPGLTGWAQINYGYGGSSGGVVEKLQYDFFYIKHQSLRLDLLIIVSTARIVLGGRGL